MDWMEWILLAVAVIACGLLVYLRVNGYITTDTVTVAFGAIVTLIRKAEDLWRDYQGAGAQKKAWVLSQLKTIDGKIDSDAAGTLIDGIVAWLNACGWDK